MDQLEIGQRLAELVALLDMIDRELEQFFDRSDRAGAEPDTTAVEDLHRDLEAFAGLAQDVLGRDLHVLEIEAAQVVATQSHRVEAFAHLEALHPLLQDQGDVPVLAIDLAPGESGEDPPFEPLPM